MTDADLPELNRENPDLRATRQEFEKIYLTELLKTFNGQVDRASKASRMDRQVLLSKLKQYGISPESISTEL